MFLDEFNENNTIKVVDETKYKSVFDLQLECIQSEYELDVALTEMTLNDSKYDLGIVNESGTLNTLKEKLKKLWDKFKAFIKKAWEWINKKLKKVKDKLKEYKNKDIEITKPFTLKIIKSPNIKYVSIKELEDMFDIIGFTARDEKSRQIWIDKCKELNLDTAKTKIQEKLSSALSIPIDKFNTDNQDNKYSNEEIKINNIEDFKKTKYYNYLKSGNMKIDNEELLDKVTDNVYIFDTGNLNLHISEAMWDESIPGFKEADNKFETLEMIIVGQYRLYHNIIFYLCENEIDNYNKITLNTKADFNLGNKINKTSDEFNDRNDKRRQKRIEIRHIEHSDD
jgi:hypothetical protein